MSKTQTDSTGSRKKWKLCSECCVKPHSLLNRYNTSVMRADLYANLILTSCVDLMLYVIERLQRSFPLFVLCWITFDDDVIPDNWTGRSQVRDTPGSNGCWCAELESTLKGGCDSCARWPQPRCSHLLSINIAGCYGNHCRLPYETSQEGSNPERGPVNPEINNYSEVLVIAAFHADYFTGLEEWEWLRFLIFFLFWC